MYDCERCDVCKEPVHGCTCQYCDICQCCGNPNCLMNGGEGCTSPKDKAKAKLKAKVDAMMEVFNEMMRLDAERSEVGHVLVLMGSRKVYAELFAKACETVLDKQTKV